MLARYRSLAFYSLALAAVTGVWLGHDLAQGAAFPPLWVVILCVAGSLFVWQFGLQAPKVGLISMERLVQIGLLLVLSTPVAAAICGCASLLWPLVSRSYSQGSSTVAVIRAVHNASMTALMLMVGGHVYALAGGRAPLNELALHDVAPLILMALSVQAVNVATMALFFRFDRRDVRRIITPAYALSDLVFVPAGVLAAVLYNTGELATFGLFVVLMVVFVLSFNSIGHSLSAADAERRPLARLFQTTRALHGARRIDELGDRILTETHVLFRFDEFYLALVDRPAGLLELRVHERRGERLAVRTKPIDAGLFGWTVKHAQPLLIKDWQHAPEELHRLGEVTAKETGSVIVVPLIEQGTVIGLLSIQHTQAEIYSEGDLHLMRRLGEQIAAKVADAQAFEDLEDYRRDLEQRVAQRTVELEKANREKERLIAAMREDSRTLERESQEDPLTGVANRRVFTRRLAAEIEVALAIGQPLTLAIADLDHFKVVNDVHGHVVGDQTLRECAALMRRFCKGTELLARIGGEEFAILLPGMGRDAATEFCELLRQALESHDWHSVSSDLRVTVSIGLSQWDGSTEPVELLRAADTRLYQAKKMGRNRVA